MGKKVVGEGDSRVLEMMESVDRAGFVPEEWVWAANEDRPLPIGWGQTVSQPYTVARMLGLLVENIKTHKLKSLKILEVGTGSGWQTVILARLFKEVYSIEVVPQLAGIAKKRIQSLRLTNVTVMIGDGKKGWKKHAPYDGIIVSADAQEIPETLVEQLKIGGRIVIPVQEVMTRGTKVNEDRAGEMKWEKFERYVFVPLV